MTASLLHPSDQSTQRIILEGVSWKTYLALLKDMGDHRASLLAYDQGILEIIMPSGLHEIINRLLERMVIALTEELGMKIKGYGSTTLNREDLQRGVEPDSCFYIQNVDRILGRELDIEIDPPPDLAVEVDITSSSRRRFGIYLQLQIPEVWRYTQQKGLVIYQLQSDEYVECELSPTFPKISGAVLMQFLQRAETEDDNSVIRSLRQWIRDSVSY
ncbi:Uma2 family endonuclease [Kovacikia minuta CCNUW1]|uniref:Uma2 family endonuclease n=1 Tax=Kovacikia minuta TaxID=2931930 RepID=UPI001CCF288C|nr:Uma2 family endonuclease [Kovacikia minuta]UBF25042.1 Uma2 family endonuclease [Kovacikia minuta CCNUW1]